jgi:hypothetical protein
MDLVALLREHLGQAHPDVTCSLLETFVEALMGAEVDALCGAAYHRPNKERTNRRNGYHLRPSRHEAWHHQRVRSRSCAEGSSFPDWISERRRRSEVAPTSVIATCGVLGVSTRRLEKLTLSPSEHEAVEVPDLQEMTQASTPRSRRVARARSMPVPTGSSRPMPSSSRCEQLAGPSRSICSSLPG